MVSIEIRQHFVASSCEEAFQTIRNTEKELAATKCQISFDDLESQNNLNLISEMLKLREPLHGRKYFQVKFKTIC